MEVTGCGRAVTWLLDPGLLTFHTLTPTLMPLPTPICSTLSPLRTPRRLSTAASVYQVVLRGRGVRVRSRYL